MGGDAGKVPWTCPDPTAGIGGGVEVVAAREPCQDLNLPRSLFLIERGGVEVTGS